MWKKLPALLMLCFALGEASSYVSILTQNGYLAVRLPPTLPRCLTSSAFAQAGGTGQNWSLHRCSRMTMPGIMAWASPCCRFSCNSSNLLNKLSQCHRCVFYLHVFQNSKPNEMPLQQILHTFAQTLFSVTNMKAAKLFWRYTTKNKRNISSSDITEPTPHLYQLSCCLPVVSCGCRHVGTNVTD